MKRLLAIFALLPALAIAQYTVPTYSAGALGSVSQVATPTFSPGAGTYSSTQTVTISTATSLAVLCYTTDGSTPTESSNLCSGGTTQTYTTPISVATTQTVKAIGTLASYTDSNVGSALYTIGISTVVVDVKSSCTGDPNPCYTTLAAALSAKATNLVTAQEIMQFVLYTSGETLTYNMSSSTAWVTNSTYYVDFAAASGNTNQGIPGRGFVWTCSSNEPLIVQNGNSVHIEDIELTCSGNVSIFNVPASGTTLIVDRDYLVGVLEADQGSGANGGSVLVRNSVVVDTSGNISGITNNNTTGTLALAIYNSVIDVGASGKMIFHSGTTTIKNTQFPSTGSAGGSPLSYSATVTCNYCSFKGAPTFSGSGVGYYFSSGANNRVSQTFTFESSPPYQITSADTSSKGFGENLSTDATWPFTIDMLSNTRTNPWDIGAYIYGP